jgi:GNAT superfamily N-acetyltransferase
MDEALFALLCEMWPRLRTALPRAAALGARWDELSSPFTRTDGDRVVAHAGVLVVPMTIDRARVPVAGLHAVCTAPTHRGRGLARAVLADALAHADTRADLMLLHAVDPALYARFGFRALEPVAWIVDAPVVVRAPARFVPLSDARGQDVERVRAALPGRTPVSRRLAAHDDGRLFVLDEVLACGGFGRLWYAPDLDVIAAFEVEGDVLRLYDVVARELPALREIVARVDGPIGAVELFFAPDRLAPGATRMRPLRDADIPMVRGPWPLGDAVAIPPLSRW